MLINVHVQYVLAGGVLYLRGGVLYLRVGDNCGRHKCMVSSTAAKLKGIVLGMQALSCLLLTVLTRVNAR